MATLERGDPIGEYRIGDQTRSGTAGSIFRAEQAALRRPVVLQTAAASADSPDGRRFLDVARLLARVDHPNLLDVYDVDVADGVPFAVMREPPGQSLRNLIATEGPLDRRRAARLGEQLASALETLDAAGVSFQRVSLDDVFLDGRGDAEHAYVAPLGDLVDAGAPGPVLESSPSRSAAALGALLSSVTELPPAAAMGETPSAVALAAREALVPASQRRTRLSAAAVVLVVIVAALVAGVVLATRSRHADAAAEPVARVVATIPLGASPRSLAVGEGAVWVATAKGQVVRVDPKTNEVVGQPIRFGKADAKANLTIRAGAGLVFVLDGSGGRLTRIDPRRNRVTGRLHLGGYLSGATVAGGLVWVLRSSPEGVQPPSYQLVRVDPARLKIVGKPYAVGSGALDVQVRAGIAWVENGGDGTVTRIDPRRDTSMTVRVGTTPLGSAVRGSTLWVPDFWGDNVVPLDTSLERPPADVVRGMHHPFSVAETAGSLWVASLAGPSTNAPVILDRLDPASRRLLGRAVPLGGQQVGWMVSGFGSIWVQDGGTNTLTRYDPAHLSGPGPSPASRPTSLRILVPGPLAVGEWRLPNPRVPFRVSIREPGWLETGPTTYGAQITRFEAPETSVTVMAPTQLFLASGRVEPLPDAAHIIRALRANRHLVVRLLPSAEVGGVSATRVSIGVKLFKGYPTFCPDACVAIFGLPNNTIAAESRAVTRISLLSFRGKMIVVLEQTDREHGALAETAKLVRSLRLG